MEQGSLTPAGKLNANLNMESLFTDITHFPFLHSTTRRPSFIFIVIVFLPPTFSKPSLFTTPSLWWVYGISKPLRTAPVTTGTDHRGSISAPGRSGFILPSPAQRNTALLSPVLGCQPLIIEFPIDPLPSARL